MARLVEHYRDRFADRDGRIPATFEVAYLTGFAPHPDLVANRIVRFAEVVGRGNVIASTDCGLGGRVHPRIAFAILEALGEVARRATKRLW